MAAIREDSRMSGVNGMLISTILVLDDNYLVLCLAYTQKGTR